MATTDQQVQNYNHALRQTSDQSLYCKEHWLQLTAWAFAALLDLALNPNQTAEGFLRYKRKSATTNVGKIDEYYDLNPRSQ